MNDQKSLIEVITFIVNETEHDIRPTIENYVIHNNSVRPWSRSVNSLILNFSWGFDLKLYLIMENETQKRAEQLVIISVNVQCGGLVKTLKNNVGVGENRK